VSRHASDRTLSSSVKCARSPAAGLTQVELPLANLADILLDLGRKQKLSKSPDIRFRNRTTDDLPTEIQGRAFWQESQTEGRSAYHLREGLYTYPVEYINGTWYKISWTIDECYEVSREDEIINLQEKGLGTKNRPFLLAPDLERIHTEVTQGSDEAPEARTTSPASDPDIPTTDQAHAPVIEQLTKAMAAIAVAHVQPAQVAGPAQAQQPAGGQPAGGGQPQQPPAGGQPPWRTTTRRRTTRRQWRQRRRRWWPTSSWTSSRTGSSSTTPQRSPQRNDPPDLPRRQERRGTLHATIWGILLP
jgi:hypothetical protein